MPFPRSRPAAFALFAALSFPVSADVVVLANGDRFTGNLLQVSDGRLQLELDATGAAVTLPWDRVVSLATDGVVRVSLADDTEIEGRVRPAVDGHIRLITEDRDGPVEVALESVVSASVPSATPPEESLTTSGNIDAGGSFTRGNTRTESYNLTGRVEARGSDTRFRLNARATRTRDDGELSRDNSSGTARYDRFLSERVYSNLALTLARDPFQDLRLRTALSVGLGYQFFETAHRSLSAELGVAYVNEDYYEAEDQQDPAGRWAVDYEEQLFGSGVELFHLQQGLVSLDQPEDFLIETESGIRFPLGLGITGTVQMDMDYTGRPAGESSEVEQAYLITIGYSW